jgi:hypothetical protein
MVIATLLVLAMAFMCHMLCEIPPPFLSIWLVEVSPSNLNDQKMARAWTHCCKDEVKDLNQKLVGSLAVSSKLRI